MQQNYLRSLLLLVILFGISPLYACDLCGIAVGLNPNFNQNQIGLRYRYRSFLGHHSHTNGASDHTEGSDLESFNSFELTGRWCIGEKWRLQGLLPYNINREFSDDILSTEQLGIGDITLTAMREIWQRADTGSHKFGHRLFAGIGLGLPTGRFRVHSIADYSPLSMPGSGAWSGLVLVNYLIRHNRWGLSFDASHRALTTNAFDYHMAARTNFNANLFYRHELKKWSLLPFVGAYLETAGKDKFQGVSENNTGGLAAFTNGGLEVYRGNMSLSFQAQLPTVQALNGSQGLNRTRITTGIFYSF